MDIKKKLRQSFRSFKSRIFKKTTTKTILNQHNNNKFKYVFRNHAINEKIGMFFDKKNMLGIHKT